MYSYVPCNYMHDVKSKFTRTELYAMKSIFFNQSLLLYDRTYPNHLTMNHAFYILFHFKKAFCDLLFLFLSFSLSNGFMSFFEHCYTDATTLDDFHNQWLVLSFVKSVVQKQNQNRRIFFLRQLDSVFDPKTRTHVHA